MSLNAYSTCTPLTTGCFLYTDSGLTTPVSNGVYSNGTNTYTVTGGSGEITSVGTCPTTTTTTTSTTTTTTTAEPTTSTTTTTTTDVVCTDCYNNTGNPISASYTDCNGNPQSENVNPGQSICVQGTSCPAFLTDIGTCSPPPPTTTSTTTTTTTAEPTTSTTTTTTTAEPTTSTTTTTTTSNIADITVSNSSLDIAITSVTVNGVAVTHTSGTNFTINAGDPTGYFTTNELGTYDIVVYYNSSISNQNILIIDCASNSQCCTTTGSGGSCTLVGASISGGCTINIAATDGACV